MMSFIPFRGDYSQVGKILEAKRLLSREQFKDILKTAKQEGKSVAEALFDYEQIPSDQLLEILGHFMKVPVIKLRDLVIAPMVLNLIPKEIAEQHSVIVFKKIKETLYVATTTPENEQTIDFIQKKTGLTPQVFLTTPEDIKFALRKYKSELSAEFATMIEQSVQEAVAVHESAEKMATFVPIIKMVDAIIEKALMQKASDIHIEADSRNIVIRFRIDGLLHRMVELPKQVHSALVARIKLMANLKLDEHRQPQDGRFKIAYDDREIAVRVSIVPTLYGAKIVMRLLDAEEQKTSLRKLGFNKRDLATIKSEIAKPHGMILVTGPTGSGKTTTLYTLLKMLHREDVNICTIEDPIEYGLDGINQTQIAHDGGISFASGLRALLRQDPDIIMVGEIRDIETAGLAVNAAMTGHLVLSTLHTNTVFLTPQRLMEMGIEPFLAASVINIIVGQRLVRKVCTACTVHSYATSKPFDRYREYFDIEGTYAKLQQLQLLPSDLPIDRVKFATGKGCAKCSNTGYLGRLGIYELLKIDDTVSKMILQRVSGEMIRRAVTEQGALTMQEDGILKVFQGLTTFDEVLRVTKE